MQQVLDALKYMGIGMLGIFLVMAVIFLFVLVLNNWHRITAKFKSAPSQKPAAGQDADENTRED